jgi:hypothetical protein
MSEVNTFLASGILGVVLCLIFQGLEFRGVIDVKAARWCLFAAWCVAVIGAAGSLENAPVRHRLIAASLIAFPLGAVLVLVDRWASRKVASKVLATAEPLPNLQFIRTEIQHVDFFENIPRRINTARQSHEITAVAVFGNEQNTQESAVADTEALVATISFDDPGRSHVDRGCWLSAKSHVVDLKRGSRKELVIGYKAKNGFALVENDYTRNQRDPIKHKLLRGNNLIATVRLSSIKGPAVLQEHRFKITVAPEFSIEKISDAVH